MFAVLQSYDFPDGCYAADVRAIAAATRDRFGAQEWGLVLLTNEIHGHLGIYSTLGAKMGLRACELLGGCEGMSIVSLAGETPPLSCLNDGLQVSTGATVGHGLFRVDLTREPAPEARFACGQQRLTLRLRDDCARQVAEDLRAGRERFGLSPDYWKYVRSLALRYWSEWDRREIFSFGEIDENR